MENGQYTTEPKYITSSDGLLTIELEPIKRLFETDPSKVQEIVASQIQLLTIYHNVVLDQAKRSFRWALAAAIGGFGFFLTSVIFLVAQQDQNIAVVSLISGSLIEVIAGINFYLYGKTSIQLSDFQNRLDRTQRFLLANSVCEGLNGDAKQKSRSELVRAIAGIGSTIDIEGSVEHASE
ncbi:hypothetical protein O4G98_05180 [Zoogloeaceae bacterium G21618-S1]|nr:hypothetical protein [Zoogloeaceae bacterium G21618-S1]